MEACYLEKTQKRSHEWRTNPGFRESWRIKGANRLLAEMWEYPYAEASDSLESTESRFMRLADKWAENTAHISSASDLINDPSYQEIISMGWSVVPYLLTDLQRNQRFWFPALAAITGIRPFDASDYGNGRRMIESWVKWGKRKGLI